MKSKTSLYWMRYIAPALLIYAVFMAYPLISSLASSLFLKTSTGTRFAGFHNFIRLFTDKTISTRYWAALWHTFVFFAIHMLVQNVLGIFFASMLTEKTMKGSSIYRTIIFIPTTFAVLITGYLWKLILNPVWADSLFGKTGLAFLVHAWLGDSRTALVVVSLVSCWQWLGIPTMMFSAAFQNIPDELIEAGKIEGAGPINIFFKIKIPLIMPVIGMVAILTFVNNFNAFDIVFAMENANGAPGYATDILGTLFYRVGIAGQHPVGIPDPSLGAAIATITFFLLCLGVIPTLYKTQTK